MSRDKLKTKTYEDKFVGINLSLLNSPAYIALDRAARALFIDMRVKLNGYNNGNINAALSELKHRGWNSSATLSKCLRQLEAAGFVALTRQSIGVKNGSKVCNLYRFTDQEVFEQSKQAIAAMHSTHDYRLFKTLTEARRAVSAASAPKKKATLQKMKRTSSIIEAIGPFDASVIEVGQQKPH